MEGWTLVLVFWFSEFSLFSTNIIPWTIILINNILLHAFEFWIYSLFLEEWFRFRLITKKSEINTSWQKVDFATLHSTVTFTDLGEVRIIVDNSMWLISLWMWQIYYTKSIRNVFRCEVRVKMARMWRESWFSKRECWCKRRTTTLNHKKL